MSFCITAVLFLTSYSLTQLVIDNVINTPHKLGICIWWKTVICLRHISNNSFTHTFTSNVYTSKKYMGKYYYKDHIKRKKKNNCIVFCFLFSFFFNIFIVFSIVFVRSKSGAEKYRQQQQKKKKITPSQQKLRIFVVCLCRGGIISNWAVLV